MALSGSEHLNLSANELPSLLLVTTIKNVGLVEIFTVGKDTDTLFAQYSSCNYTRNMADQAYFCVYHFFTQYLCTETDVKIDLDRSVPSPKRIRVETNLLQTKRDSSL